MAETATEVLTREQWIQRAAAHYAKRAGLEPHVARSTAEATWSARAMDPEGDFETPEEAVDEDLSYWTDDEGGL